MNTQNNSESLISSKTNFVGNICKFHITGKVVNQSEDELTIEVSKENTLKLHLSQTLEKPILSRCVYATGEIINGALEVSQMVVSVRDMGFKENA